MNVPVARIECRPTYRIIPSRFPPIDLFERVADPADLEAVWQIESLTNDRIRDEVGDLTLVPPEDRISGPGTSAVMAAFTHLNPQGSRFTRGAYGVYYAAAEVETAIDETRYHRARFMAATDEPAMELNMRVYLADLVGELHDIRDWVEVRSELYDPDDYSAAQAFGASLWAEGSNGIAYASVRRPSGECFAVFRPPVLGNCRQERHLCYVWDGRGIATVYEKRRFEV